MIIRQIGRAHEVGHALLGDGVRDSIEQRPQISRRAGDTELFNYINSSGCAGPTRPVRLERLLAC